MMRLEKLVGFFIADDGLSFGAPGKRTAERARHVAEMPWCDRAMPRFGGGDAGSPRLDAVDEISVMPWRGVGFDRAAIHKKRQSVIVPPSPVIETGPSMSFISRIGL